VAPDGHRCEIAPPTALPSRLPAGTAAQTAVLSFLPPCSHVKRVVCHPPGPAPQHGTVDCGPVAVLALLAAAVVGVPFETIADWPIPAVTHAGRYLRARMAVDPFSIGADEVRGARQTRAQRRASSHHGSWRRHTHTPAQIGDDVARSACLETEPASCPESRTRPRLKHRPCAHTAHLPARATTSRPPLPPPPARAAVQRVPLLARQPAATARCNRRSRRCVRSSLLRPARSPARVRSRVSPSHPRLYVPGTRSCRQQLYPPPPHPPPPPPVPRKIRTSQLYIYIHTAPQRRNGGRSAPLPPPCCVCLHLVHARDASRRGLVGMRAA
jgi:hypothetical protein